MSVTSDITLDASRFNPENITEQTKQVNDILEKVTTNGPRWHEVGVEKYRQMRETGETPLPVPVYLAEAKDAELPSRDAGRPIPVRVYTPENGQPSKGIFLHIHGGGFVLGTHKQYAPRLALSGSALLTQTAQSGQRTQALRQQLPADSHQRWLPPGPRGPVACGNSRLF
jgi:hypothetical protein